MWCVNNPHDKFKVANALIYYFRQINEHVDSNHFAFFVLVRGRQPRIYSQWRDVVDWIINYLDQYYRGFYTFHEAIEFATHEIGPNYHVSHLINPLNNASASSSRQSNNLL